jgi:hypothetical protein
MSDSAMPLGHSRNITAANKQQLETGREKMMRAIFRHVVEFAVFLTASAICDDESSVLCIYAFLFLFSDFNTAHAPALIRGACGDFFSGLTQKPAAVQPTVATVHRQMNA